VALVGLAVGLARLLAPSPPPPVPGCDVAGGAGYRIGLEQASNVTTIAAVGKRLGMPDHAVTVALAAALQESRLRNLPYGDLDSRGLFQQRPSQGWGTATQVMTPRYAAAAFYQHLALVPGWATLPVTVAAQRVQRSGTPTAYAQWELEARALARATTGEVPAGLSCHVVDTPRDTAALSLQQAMTLDLGAAAIGVPVAEPRGWTVSCWLVGHATEFGITSVGFAGQEWTAAGGSWGAVPVIDSVIHVGRVPQSR
jgi:hypothetical protein